MDVMDTPTTLSIDSAEAAGLAARLSALTGDSVADAVVKALRTELEHRERERDIVAEAERMVAMGREIRALIRGPVSSDMRDMYDEHGLPV